jgi:4-amino-4-deoxy-L-arabinose transferase-like glycosyltransferase
MEREDKIIILAMLGYLIIASIGLGGFEFFWDETQNTAPSVFMYDLSGRYLSGGMSFQDIRDYAVDYHAHYQFALNFLHHPLFQRIVVFVSYAILGVSEFSSRFPTVIFGVLGILATYLLACEMTKDRKTALLSAAVLALSSYYFIYSRMAMMEVIITTMITFSFYFFWKYMGSGRRRHAAMLGLALGLAISTKIYGILVIPIILLYVATTRKFSLLKDRKLWGSLVIAGIISLPWYVFAFFVLPDMLGIPSVALNLYVSYLRFGGFNMLNMIAYFFKQFLVMGFIVFLGVVYALQKRDRQSVLLLSWAFVFYSFFMLFISPSSAHLSRFVMPAMPAFAIVAAIFLRELVGINWKTLSILMVALLVSVGHLMVYYPTISYASEDAATWALERTQDGEGIISTEYGMQFYFMKHDRNISRYFFMTDPSDEDPFERLLDAEYSDPMNEALGIRNPEFRYLILKEPPRNDLAYTPLNFLLEIIVARGNTHRTVESRPEEFVLVNTLYDNEDYAISIYEIVQDDSLERII